MNNRHNIDTWFEQEGSQDMPDLGPARSDVGGGMDTAMVAGPNVTDPAGPEEKEPEDVSRDPAPDAEGLGDESQDFESWRKEYFDLAIKGDINEMLDAIGLVRDRSLTAPQRRFVEDNLQILLLRQDANFEKASKEIRKLVNQEMDRNNPAVSLMDHIYNTLQSYPFLNTIFIKLAGQGALKGELHRRRTLIVRAGSS